MEKTFVLTCIPGNILFRCIFIAMIIVILKCEEPCSTSIKQGDVYEYNCNNRSFERIPDPTIVDRSRYQNLILTHCPNLKIYYEDFTNWTGLSFLTLSDIQSSKQTTFNAFEQLINVTILRFYTSNLSDEQPWIYPPATSAIHVIGNDFVYPDFSSAIYLTQLSVRDNKLKRLVKVYNTSTVKWIDADNNPFDELTITDVAIFCNLEIFDNTPAKNSPLLKSGGRCRCMQLKLYVHTFKVRSFSDPWNCPPQDIWNILWDCDLTLIEVKPIRTKCGDGHLVPLPAKRNWIAYLVKMVMFLFLILLILLCYIMYRTYKNLQQPIETPPPAEYQEEEGLVEEEET